MRFKKSPRRLIRQNNEKICSDVDSENHNWKQCRPIMEFGKYSGFISSKKQENKLTSKNGPLDLSQQSQKYELAARKIIESTEISNVALDLSMKTINKNLIQMKNNNETKSSNASTSKNPTEFKNLFLYKMLTDSTFIDKIKRMKNTNLITCEYCKKNFSSQVDLYNHQNQQLDGTNNLLSCCACNKLFTQRRYLRYHQRSHSEQSKFSCEICTRKYSRMDNLTRHNTFHTNPDKFPCSLCDRTFARKDLLNKHIKGHENKYRYYCDKCNKYFRGPLSLGNHNKSYHPTTQ